MYHGNAAITSDDAATLFVSLKLNDVVEWR